MQNFALEKGDKDCFCDSAFLSLDLEPFFVLLELCTISRIPDFVVTGLIPVKALTQTLGALIHTFLKLC